MKKLYFPLLLILCSIGVMANASGSYSANLGGATGLITTPSAHTAWEGNDLGFDAGFGYNANGNGNYIPKATVQLFNRWEIGGTFELQDGDNNNDLFLHTKLRFYPWSGKGNSALALGGNWMHLNLGNTRDAYQVYLAATYGGTFFTLPAETTMVIGKTFGDNIDNSNIDFSMGFDLDMFPSIFRGYVHWINDFSNYSYTIDYTNMSGYRGAFNTGARILPLKSLGNFKLVIDVLLLDALDSDRDFGAQVVFGMSF